MGTTNQMMPKMAKPAKPARKGKPIPRELPTRNQRARTNKK